LITRIPDILDMLSEKSNGELEVCASRVATATADTDKKTMPIDTMYGHLSKLFRGNT
jgi:hypothetical protein